MVGDFDSADSMFLVKCIVEFVISNRPVEENTPTSPKEVVQVYPVKQEASHLGGR